MIWDGVYHRWDQLPHYDLLDLDEWDAKQRVKLNDIRLDPTIVRAESSFLLSALGPETSFVDYGGSLALTYEAIKDIAEISEYHVIETPTIVRSGESLFPHGVVQFRTIEIHPKKVDVLYIRTALQYAQDWRKDLKRLLEWSPSLIVLAHTSAGPVPTYLTIQHWYGKMVPYWFINEDELIGIICKMGYRVDLIEPCDDIQAGFSGFMPQENILRTTINLRFHKL